MNTDFQKRFNLICGLVFLVFGCGLLMLLIITFQNLELTVANVVGLICSIMLILVSFFASIDAFIKYGITLGIDYSLDQQKKK